MTFRYHEPLSLNRRYNERLNRGGRSGWGRGRRIKNNSSEPRRKSQKRLGRGTSPAANSIPYAYADIFIRTDPHRRRVCFFILRSCYARPAVYFYYLSSDTLDRAVPFVLPIFMKHTISVRRGKE